MFLPEWELMGLPGWNHEDGRSRSLGKLIFRSSFLSKFNLDSGFEICPALFLLCVHSESKSLFFNNLCWRVRFVSQYQTAMDTSSRKTSLVVLFNHQYERNIPVIRELYSRRFSGLLQLMPYYKGDAPDVCSVFGNSFQFYNYILQSRMAIIFLLSETIFF